MKALTALLLMVVVPGKEATMRHATGTFEVSITPEASDAGGDAALPTARMALRKTLSGGLTGTAKGTMLSIGTPKPGAAAAYVALDQVTGTLDGRSGGFVLVHRGTMSKAGGGELSIEIAPDSGTGGLQGISGTLSIEVAGGAHHYDLTYSLPD